MKKTYLAALVFALSWTVTGYTAEGEDSLLKDAQSQFQPIPDKAPAIKDNETSPDKIELGKMLYFEPRLSKSALISCNTCHNVGLGGADY